MTQLGLEDVMNLLEVDLTSKRMDILKALLKVQPESGAYVEFSKIKAELESSSEGRSIDRSLVHRQLKSLVEEGYIRADKSGYRHKYTTDIGTLAKLLETKLTWYRNLWDKQVDRIDNDLQLFNQTDPSGLGEHLVELMSGKKDEESPHFASGIDGIIRLFRSEIHSKARRGETIKATIDWLNIEIDITVERFSWLSDLASRNLKVMVLRRYSPARRIQKRILRNYEVFQDLGFDVDYRVRTSKKATYQFIGTARTGIVLVVSENPLASTWIPRQSNPLLIDQAIEVFDRDFQSAKPLNAMIKGK